MLETKAANVSEHGLSRTDCFSRLNLCAWEQRDLFSDESVFAEPILPLDSRQALWTVAAPSPLAPVCHPLFHGPGEATRLDKQTRRQQADCRLFCGSLCQLCRAANCRSNGRGLASSRFRCLYSGHQRSSGLEARFMAMSRRRVRSRGKNFASWRMRLAWVAFVCSEPSAALMLKQNYPDLLQ